MNDFSGVARGLASRLRLKRGRQPCAQGTTGVVARGLASRLRLKQRSARGGTNQPQRRTGTGFSPEIETHFMKRNAYAGTLSHGDWLLA